MDFGMQRFAMIAVLLVLMISTGSSAVQTINSGGNRGSSTAGTTAQSTVGEPAIGSGTLNLDSTSVKSGFEYLLAVDLNSQSDNTFDTGQVQPGGSADGWSTFGLTLLDPDLSTGDYDVTNGAYRVGTLPMQDRYHLAGWTNNRLDWLPYSSIGTGNYVRGKFYIYAQGQSNPNEPREIPNFAIRLASRFAITAELQLTLHNADLPADAPASLELRPSTDPENPSIYRLDYDPIDIPFLQTSTSHEGVMSGFNVFTLEDADNGYICLTELELGTYPTSLLADANALHTRVYEPTETDAGNMKIYNSASDLRIYNFYSPPGTPIGAPSEIEQTGELAQDIQSSAGITIDSRNVLADRVGVVEHAFYAGDSDGSPGYANRIRTSENRLFKIRYHVTSSIPTSDQSWLWLVQRTIKFSYTQSLQLGGGRSSNAANSLALVRQSIPGIGCLNQDKIADENGGWYTVLMNSPMNADIRPEFAPGTPLSTRMPIISAMPGPGDDQASNRDVKVQLTAYDTLSNSTTGGEQEHGLFTVDRVEIGEFNQIGE
jgi:hypothetical protein